MSDNLSAPSLGAGPYGVEHDEGDGFFYLTLSGVRTGKSFPLGKTAYRAARQFNEADGKAAASFLEDDAPTVASFKGDKAKLEKAALKIGRAILKPKAKPTTTIPGFAPAPGDPATQPGLTAKERVAREPKPKAAPKVKAEAPKAADPACKFGTRDEWLNAFIAAARPVFKAADLELPEKVRASIGWMFRSSNKKTLGQCWHEASSADGTREIWINPTLGGDDSSRIADVLTHELAHTLFGPEEKHGKNFKAAVHKLGLEGKATATTAGQGWREWAGPILAELGPIPHAALDPSLSGVKKKKTYLLKATCEACEFTFRATAKHLNGKALRCPDEDCGGSVAVEGAEDLGEGDGE